VLVAVFQWGWAATVLGRNVETGSIQTITPPLVLAVVFGLSMDYEVFLLSRIRERYDASGDTRRAVAEGLATSARTITGAALIMVAVFAVLVSTGVPSIKEIGLGCAVAIAVDATIVRLVLVPAAMELLGRFNWWLRRPLARLGPRPRGGRRLTTAARARPLAAGPATVFDGDMAQTEPPAVPNDAREPAVRPVAGDLDQARRTSMAAERTWLAWWRSALAASAGALAVGRLAPDLLHVAPWPYILLGCGYASLAVGLLVVGALRQRDLEQAMRSGRHVPLPFWTVGTFTVGGVALAVMTAVLVVAQT
jgi:uncharacterized membrane protein YidH (DUF202 family)